LRRKGSRGLVVFGPRDHDVRVRFNLVERQDEVLRKW
jgi:hypothetical protein